MIVRKTELGLQVIKDRSVQLSAAQRSALILCDGKRRNEEIVQMAAGLGATGADIETLLSLGLVQDIAAVAQAAAPVAAASASTASAKQIAAPVAKQSSESQAPAASQAGVNFLDALNETILLCSNLGFKGFGLTMALTNVDTLEKLQRLAPEVRRAAGDKKYAPIHQLIFGKPL